ncbi:MULTISPECIES: xanthine dehydrogenase family protein molybdopterin-binding subunit [unclassified Leisingera]|uniref:xanthine dehydrogenase family protein molybdopterin-binding subunit n=1 Tax=unclassified Leisingera TaxID=2614906 RepID=UPI00030746EC|nr:MULTISPECIES: molybdopterin cofactor-binding domain-containing protein [unclassified Leisingera]KIC15439.1 dehydrogenase [Leisingera sp. ANG-DT]KIC23538.1 dehydrogenase [Leisingera sp. ANG-S3]KIC54066.1 dehydrogenase [Leisingera sp. ANG-S]KID09697.1 dehydrogenase [Leisingera sp. ANG1]
MTLNTSRRGFLESAAAAAAVLYVGVRPDGALAAGAAPAQLNPFVKIDADGTVTAIVKHFEKGQGPATGLTTLIAEELGVSMEDIQYEFAPSDPSRYANLAFGQMQGTGGSTAMANSFMQYRQAGAAAREMLIKAAAEAWGADATELTLEDGVIKGAGQEAPLAEFVAATAQMEAPAEPRLKDPSEFRLIGNASVKRKDSLPKTNGTAMYAMDLHLPNQMVAVIIRTPRMGGLASGFDDAGAKAVKGYIRAAVLPNQAGVAVYAEDTWAAFQARDAITVDWDFSNAESRSSDQIREELLAAVNAEPEYNVTGADHAATTEQIEGAAQVVEQTFYFPLLAHAPMEPLTCTIEADADGGVTLHDGCQFPTGPHMALAQIFQLPMEKVRINTMFAGGSFGRRATPTADYQVEAALAFALTDRTRPVKLVWSREDDITGGYYRPAVAHRVRVGLDAAGNITGWDHRIAAQSILKGTAFESMMVHGGVDHSSVEGVADTPYRIPGQFTGLTDVAKATSVLWWRSVGHTHTAYVMEVMMDEAARAAGRDPVDFRLTLLEGGGDDQQRLAGVLILAADKGGWGSAPEGRSQGIAVHKSFGSYVAELVEISGNADGGVKIEKVTCAVDCGIAVNPDVIKAQMEGGIGYGLGHAMRNVITLTGGEVDQFNFPDYEPLRIGDIGAIEVHIVPSAEMPTGVGEPGTPPSAPALANAIAVNGPRVTALPMNLNGVSFA